VCLRSIHPQKGEYGEPPTHHKSSAQSGMVKAKSPSTEPIFTNETQTIKMIFKTENSFKKTK
jgi:hypothetical protein